MKDTLTYETPEKLNFLVDNI